MIAGWEPEELRRIDAAAELLIAVERADGTMRPWTPIWVVRVGAEVFVRTWYRRDTGWFGAVLGSGRARIRVPGLEVGVVVEDVGHGGEHLRGRVDAAYQSKYAASGPASVTRMRTDEAAATTLRLGPARAG